ncbi:hypothetical protein F4802DRAFT_618800 [Xylaria palmicola]|nr:hypothetical protein F4802DRAFT_618800 [Xylaria palmicola]
MNPQRQYDVTGGLSQAPRPKESRLAFFIEIGVRYAGEHPYGATIEKWKAYLEPTRLALWRGGIVARVVTKESQRNFSSWCMTENRDDESSFDIVSPHFDYYGRETWISAVGKAYNIIKEAWPALDMLGTRIQIITPPAWTTPGLKFLAMSVCRYNKCFNSLHSQLKLLNTGEPTQSHPWIPDSGDDSRWLERQLGWIQAAENRDMVAQIMNTSPDGKGHLRVWNFWPLVYNPPSTDRRPEYDGHEYTGALEYNLVPGPLHPNNMIDLACLFVRRALVSQGGCSAYAAMFNHYLDLFADAVQQAREAHITKSQLVHLTELFGFLEDAVRSDAGQP